MRKRLPSPLEIQELVRFLPRLSADGFAPIKKWEGGANTREGGFKMPWPVYDKVVEDFILAASKDVWNDHDYRPEEARRMLENESVVATANLTQIRTMLTYCVRGERFCDGHWGTMIERGHVRRLLKRLVAIGQETD